MSVIRVGVIGAGANTKSKHIPLLQTIDGVEVHAVCNRTLESSQKVCSEFGIPKAFKNPLEILEDSSINAVLIGTWPYKHAEFTIKALNNAKHVLTEARMAMNADEAESMLAVSLQHPGLVAQVVPAPFTLQMDETIRQVVANELGKLIGIELFVQSGKYPDPAEPQTWRQRRLYSGNNIMSLGIHYEAMMRWVGEARNVFAQFSTQVTESISPLSQHPEPNDIPDRVLAAGKLHRDDADFMILASNVDGGEAKNYAELHGWNGTLRVIFGKDLLFRRKGEATFSSLSVRYADQKGWRVEEEFIAAIRGQQKVQRTTFRDGYRYMRFTDALHLSRQTGSRVTV